MGTRNVDPGIAAARSALANATKSGDYDSVLEARVRLELAKAEEKERKHAEWVAHCARVQQEVEAQRQWQFQKEAAIRDAARAFLADPFDRSAVVALFAETGPTKALHNVLEIAQMEVGREFLDAHGDSSKWDDATRAAHDEIRDRNRTAHVQYGCKTTDPCLRGPKD